MNNNELHEHALKLVRKIEHFPEWDRLEKKNLFTLLKASDCLLMNAYEDSVGAPITELDTEGGSLDLGPFLYTLNHPSLALVLVVKPLVKALESAEGMALPKSQFTPDTWKALLKEAETKGIVGPGGVIWGDNKYEQLDPGWIYALLMFAVYELGILKRHRFGDTPNIIDVNARRPLKIVIVGDWGTGKFGSDGGPAVAVMKGIESLQPDIIIHLGDVYYAGTRFEERKKFRKMWPEDMEENRSFTLNSNHEMYDGANGYFKTALKAGGPFSAQQQTSYFAIKHGDWLFLGLDSAFFSKPDKLYMNGCIGGAHGDQANWLRKHFSAHDPEKIVIFTHHTPTNLTGKEMTDGDSPDSLWNEVRTALGNRSPGYWYFGHTHNAVVYSSTSAIGKAGCHGRLVGHGAIPFGKAYELPPVLKSGQIEYFANTFMESHKPRVRNGFASIEIDNDGNMKECFYEVADGTVTAVKVWP